MVTKTNTILKFCVCFNSFDLIKCRFLTEVSVITLQFHVKHKTACFIEEDLQSFLTMYKYTQTIKLNL